MSEDEMAAAFEAATDDTAGDLGEVAEAPEAEAPVAEEIDGGEGTGTEDAELFTIVVDGEELQVPRDELLNGYQRQADYTRKTQELAEQRRELEHVAVLAEHLQTDPARVVAAISEAFGLDKAEDVEDELLDPEEARWREFESFKEQLELERAEREIDLTLARLHQNHGDFDDNALIQFAVDNEISNLQHAFQIMDYQRVQETVRKQQSERQAREAKASAPPVAGGHSVAPKAVTPGASGPFTSIDDAWAAAVAQHSQ